MLVTSSGDDNFSDITRTFDLRYKSLSDEDNKNIFKNKLVRKTGQKIYTSLGK